MPLRTIVVTCAAALVLLCLTGLRAPGAEMTAATSTAAFDPAAAFEVDIAHSTVLYRLRHLGVCNFYGRVNAPKGNFRFDPDHLDESFLRVTMELKNMDAGNKSRDRFLMSPDFFNVREFPTAEFKSIIVRQVEDGYEADGEFTMRGVMKKITVPIREFTTAPTERFGFRGGFDCTFTIKRSDYGMDRFVEDGTLGDDVQITASIEGVQR